MPGEYERVRQQRPPENCEKREENNPHEHDSQDMFLREQRQRIEYEREIKEHWYVHKAKIWLIAVLSYASVAIIFSFSWHLCMPQCLRWLSDADMANIKSIVITMVSSIVLAHVATFISGANKK